ncbi:helix-turn-helix transcriptional regulator [Microbacterium sp.]|uniref:helix-turn-helix transcriptional regulator n=1 Tax=Microbacterium sp. TaxID=51671 RepID=UPI0039E45456
MSSHADPDLTRLRIIFVAQRDAHGWTYEELAERSGVSRQTLLNISSGKYNGDLKTWMKLARAFNTSLDELLAPVWE